MTTFCLVHGAWHDASCWTELTAELERRGHGCVTPTLAIDRLDATFADHADTVLAALADEPQPVLVGHSMSSAVVALVGARRPLRRLVYLCPALIGLPAPPGAPPMRRAGYEPPPVDDDGCSWWPLDRAVHEMYRRIDPHVARQLASRLRRQPTGLFRADYPLERPPACPSDFVYARDDELFDDDWSRWVSSHVFDIDEPLELPGGHFPMLERPIELADLLERLSD